MRGLPDWGTPIDDNDVRLFAAYELDRVRIAVPDALTVAREADGRPSFRLTAIRPIVPMPGRNGHGRLDLELRLDSSAATDDGVVRAAPPLRGWLRLRSSMLDLPPVFEEPTELDCSGLGLARLTLPLPAEGVSMIESVLEDGAVPLLAHVELEVAGVAPRLPVRAVVDLALLREALADQAMTPVKLREALMDDASVIGVKIADAPDSISAYALAEAAADHIQGRLCAGPLAPTAEDGLVLVLSDAEIATGTATLDLSLPLVVTRVVTTALDPFAAARALAEEDGEIASLIVRGQSGLLQTGRHEVTIDASVPRPCVGPLTLGAKLTFPPHPPGRMHAVIEDFELPTTGDSVIRQVRLAPGEDVAWTLSGFAIWPTPDRRGVERLDGPETAGVGTRALLRPDAFPLGFADVEAGTALLKLARVEMTLAGTRRDGAPVKITTTLTDAAPRAALALPADTENVTLTSELVAHDSSRRITLATRPAADCRIELADVPGYGPRATELVATLPEGASLVAIEVIAEDAPTEAEPEVYAFTPQTRSRTHRWLCRDPFRPGLRWRWRGQTEFSAPVTTERVDVFAEAISA